MLHNIGDELERVRRRVVASVNSAMVETYWHIGKNIVEYEKKPYRNNGAFGNSNVR
ncbi:MAG: hypothetical protein IJI41_00435 [Anaerolineaceae bacterium]|nr:hypothetical protein [Anaerolineaceae bacterium]